MPKYSESADRRVGLTLAGLSPQAEAPNAPEGRPDVLSVLKFDIGGEIFSVAVDQTEGVVLCPRVSPLPAPPHGMVGVTSVRGRITLVMDLSLGANQKAERRRLILLKGEAQLGLLADRVDGVVALAPRSIRKRPDPKPESEPATKNDQKSMWPASLYFKDSGRRVPILDIEALTEV
jgi:purine-binding chemotaxis protein CheW